MKGIVLAGGRGTRLYPMTKIISKQLLPIYDKPLIYYPMSILMLAGIREILIISTKEDIGHYQALLQDGSDLGLKLEYKVQEAPRGIAEAFVLGEDFIGDDSVCLILGDNVFYGHGMSHLLWDAMKVKEGAVVFGYPVRDPKSFGVMEFDKDMNVISIEEKSHYAVPGLYFYDNRVVEISKTIKPSARGELEITAVNNAYIEKGQLKAVLIERGIAWLDTGTPDGMLDAGRFVETIQKRESNYVACLEEIAWRRGFIDDEQLRKLGESLKMTQYGQYILSLLG